MKKREFTEEEISEMKRMYVEEKMGTPSIGKALGAHKVVINRTLRENGVELDQSGRRNTGGKSASDKRNYHKHKIKKLAYHQEWRKDKVEDLREYHTMWRDDNREHIRQYSNAYEKKRCGEDPKYRLGKRTRTAVYTCLKEANVAKYRSTFEILGFTLEELMVHIEKQFVDGMTWDNYGEWHVDHKLPMAKFNFTSTEDREFKLCWSIDNLQPLWGIDNLIKGSRYL